MAASGLIEIAKEVEEGESFTQGGRNFYEDSSG